MQLLFQPEMSGDERPCQATRNAPSVALDHLDVL
jgi:hypothetical protein